MAVICRCRCGTRFRVADHRPGERVRCPACGVVKTLPGNKPAPSGARWWLRAGALAALGAVTLVAVLAFRLPPTRPADPPANASSARGGGADRPDASPAGDGRFALLVGVDDYQHEKLRRLAYAENDVNELAATLRPHGYEVTLLTGSAADAERRASAANIDQQLRALLRKCRRGDTVLLAFAGHGLQFEGDQDSYFCPLDARPFRDQAGSLVSLGKVYRELDRSFAGMKVLLVDACRDDPGAGRGARGIDADSAPRPPQGVAALFSCRAGERAFEHESLRHGVFFHYVLEGLRGKAGDHEGEVTFAGLASYVSRQVSREVPRLVGGGARQSPNLKADYSAEPVLARLGGRPTPPSEVARPEAPAGKEEPSKAEAPKASPPADDLSFPKGLTNSLRMQFVHVPKGTLRRGGGERPTESVRIATDFQIGAHEVTQEQWRSLMGGNPSYFSRDGGGKDRVADVTDADLERFPVETSRTNRSRGFSGG